MAAKAKLTAAQEVVFCTLVDVHMYTGIHMGLYFIHSSIHSFIEWNSVCFFLCLLFLKVSSLESCLLLYFLCSLLLDVYAKPAQQKLRNWEATFFHLQLSRFCELEPAAALDVRSLGRQAWSLMWCFAEVAHLPQVSNHLCIPRCHEQSLHIHRGAAHCYFVHHSELVVMKIQELRRYRNT